MREPRGAPTAAAGLRRAVAWLALIAGLTGAGYALASRGAAPAIRNPTDFRAFYCAGRVVLARADPYRLGPIGTCESATLAQERQRWFAGLVVPAPQPPYALALFALFGTLRFLTASALWCALAIAAWLRTAALLQRLTSLGYAIVGVATFGLGLYASLLFGQLMPLTMWAILEAAAAARAGQDRRAAVFATLCTIEPHVGAPVWLALALARPRARLALLAGAGAVVAISLAATGPEICWEWIVRVLPAHASSELRNGEQYSATTLLVQLGLAPRLAQALAAVQYAVMAGLGLWAGARLSARWSDPAALVLVPPAFVVLGGPFVHEHQLVAAVPAALLGWSRTRNAAYAAAIGLLAWPWLLSAENFTPVGRLFWPMRAVLLPPAPPDALAETSWTSFIGLFTQSGWTLVAATSLKLPQWLGLGCVIVPLLVASARRPASGVTVARDARRSVTRRSG